MSARPRAIVIRAAGTNCDREMCRAFEMAGAAVELTHLSRLIARPTLLDGADLIGVAGGFSFGDDVAAGRVFAVKMRAALWPALRGAAERGVPMIGACNGFQIMAQVGLLPGPAPGEAWPEAAPEPTIALAHNAGDRFVDRWSRVSYEASSPCVWTAGLAGRGPEATALLPSAHAEGRLVASEATLDDLEATGRVAVRYHPADNPNGSARDVAGVCDASGRILGLMPHPERYLEWAHHPFRTRLDDPDRAGDPPGLVYFRNAVGAAVGAPSGGA